MKPSLLRNLPQHTTMDLPIISSLSTEDIFANIQSNLEKQGVLHIGKFRGKPTITTPGGAGGSRAAKRRTPVSLVKTTLFPSQLPHTLKTHGLTGVEANERNYSRSPSPIVEDDSKPSAYVPLCVRNEASTTPNSASPLPSISDAKPSFQALSWAAPSLDAGLGLSSFARSLTASKKRSRDEITVDKSANTATAKIAAAAAAWGTSSILFDFCSGPRYTEDEADDLVAFADKWIPTNPKRARKF